MIESRRMKLAGHIVCMLMMKNAYWYKVLIGKPERKISFRRPIHTWEDNIKIDPKEIV
jgi:hypothetical protein